MRRGKHWPIPHKEVLDGSALAMKNADRLCKDARIAYDNKRYSASLALTVLALEEYGKCLMLYETETKKRTIDQNIWHTEFEKHEAKLDAILRVLTSFPLPPDLEKQGEKELRVVTRLFQKWRNKKLEGIYLDWDGGRGKWYNYDDKPKSEKMKDAKEVLEFTERWFKIFTENMGDLAFATRQEKITALKAGRAYCFCSDCGLIMINEIEFVHHVKTQPAHNIQWFKS